MSPYQSTAEDAEMRLIELLEELRQLLEGWMESVHPQVASKTLSPVATYVVTREKVAQ